MKPSIVLLKRLRYLGFAYLLASAVVACEGAKVLKNLKSVPRWVLEEGGRETSLEGGDEGCVLLYDTLEIDVDSDGVSRVVTRQVIKITGAKGKEGALCIVPYTSDSGKVESIRAWLIQGDGKVVQYDQKDVVDKVHISAGGIASTQRSKRIDASGDARIGSVFVYETVLREAGFLRAWYWAFQSLSPSVYSSVRLAVPEGWQVLSHCFNMDELEPLQEGNTYQWTMRDLQAAVQEDWGPASTLKAMEVRVHPPAGSPLNDRIFNADSWEDFAVYFTAEYKSRSGSAEVFRDKVAELTEGVSDEQEKVRRLASFARSVNYVAISLDLGNGGGWFPRKAAEVCESNYGDCKDKSNMLCHMLAEIGVQAYPVIVNAELRHDVVEAWPSGWQFNHCIVAIEMESGFEGGSIVEHPKLGRLLIFDPTDELTALGDLHINMQGSKGLLLAGDNGGLIDLPTVQPERNVTERSIEAEIFPNGGIVAKFKESTIGYEARVLRQNYRDNVKTSGFQDRLQNRFARSVTTPKLGVAEVVDDLENGTFSLQVDFGAPQYAKTMGGTLVVFNPVVFERLSGLPFEVEGERTTDLILKPEHLEETIKIYLPQGYGVSERPERVSIVEDFGSYENELTVEDDYLICRRSVWIKRTRIPVSDYEKAKSFYERIAAADQASVVLEKL